MKRKNVNYEQQENESFSLQEPIINYQPVHNHVGKQEFTFISEDELTTNCMPLAESKRLLLERQGISGIYI